jgi:hypothetical protein
MTIEATDGKSCDPQLFPKGKPTAKWSLDQLGAYAQEKHTAIAETEKPLAAQYWLLGLALNLAREKFRHGKWGPHLKSLGIDKTRASKAIAIFKANPSEKETASMSVAETYAKRQRKKTPRPEPPAMSDKAAFRQFLHGIDEEAEKYIHVAAFLEPAEASEFALDVQ